jgi:hypothetical protein
MREYVNLSHRTGQIKNLFMISGECLEVIARFFCHGSYVSYMDVELTVESFQSAYIICKALSLKLHALSWYAFVRGTAPAHPRPARKSVHSTDLVST